MKPISPVSMYVTNSCNHTQCRHILHKTNSFGRMHFKIYNVIYGPYLM